jgi:hypothetical protein
MHYNKKEQGLSLVVFALGLAALLGFAALAIDLGISNNIQNELQKATTTSALVGALHMAPDEMGNIDQNAAKQAAVDSFYEAVSAIPGIGSVVLVNPVSQATGVNDPSFIQTIPTSRAVRVQTRAQVPTFFMAVIGIRNLQINAQAAATNLPAYPSRNLPAPTGSLIASDIKDPVGGINNNAYKCSGGSPDDASFILGPPDNVPVALGPGGSVTLRMPAPIVDGPGGDIYVRELGDLEGYYIYVGIENGGSISWTNISCTGIPTEGALSVPGSVAGAYADDNGQYKFYGSGLFDLGATCSGPGVNYTGTVNNAEYIMIMDDNVEDGILSSNLTEAVLLPGEHASSSPGADIDTVAVLHHSRIIDFDAPDSDGDGIVDPVELLIGTNPNNSDTDGDGLTDGQEFSGSTGFVTNPRVADTDGDGVNDGDEISAGTNPLLADQDR